MVRVGVAYLKGKLNCQSIKRECVTPDHIALPTRGCQSVDSQLKEVVQC